MSRPISWDLIASMRAVLETGSLSAAARSRGVTQPTIRRHVDEIEAALGVALFTRSPNGLIPTSAARDIAPYAQDIDALVAALVRTASAERDSIAGTVRLSCSEVMAAEVLPA
ncbi:MAG: LysR family transcriptional regulator, partial [Hyphomicrobiales bacterium]